MPSRRPLCSLTAVVLAAAATAAVATAPAGAHARTRVSTTGSSVSILNVVEHANTDFEVPVAKGGKDEKGDPLTFVNPIYNQADTAKIGHDEGFCMRLDPKAGVWECLWTTFVKGGSLTVQGPFYDTRDSTLAVTGGTGRYADSRGQMHLHAIDGGKKYRFDFSLS